MKRFSLYLIPALFLLAIPPATGASESFETEFSATPLMERETRLTVQIVEHAHYSEKSLAGLDAEELLLRYMKEIDYNRLFFTEGDYRQVIEAFGDSIDFDLFQGNLDPAFKIFSRYKQRAGERLEWVLARLQEEFDLNTDETFVPDRREADWPENAEDAEALWEKRLKHELLQLVLNEEEKEDALLRLESRYESMQERIAQIEAGDVQEIFITTLTKMFDPHSTFLAADTLEDFGISMRLSLVGIGAVLTTEDGYCVIREIMPGGPADLSGKLRPEDRIVAVAQEDEDPVDVVDMKLRSVVSKIRGEKDTRVTLTIIPADAPDPSVREEVTIVRDEVQLTASRARGKLFEQSLEDDDTRKIGVIEIPSFYGSGQSNRGGGRDASTTEDVRELIEKMKSLGADGIALDLRRNGGGLLNEAVNLAGLFIDSGPVVKIRDSSGQIRVDSVSNGGLAYDGPLAILVSKNSASASEIVAGSLQRYQRAVIVGDSSTHGKGTVQAVFELSNYLGASARTGQTGAAKLTVQKFYLPDGESTQNRGVVPDISIPSYNDFLPIGEASLPNALSWDTIEAGDWDAHFEDAGVIFPIDETRMTRLVEASKERRNSLEEFQYWQDNMEWFRQRQEEQAVSLNYEKRQAQREQDREFRDRMNDTQDRLAREHRYSFTEVLLDSIDNNNGATSSTPEATHPELMDIEALDEDDDEEREELDIHLRETLRILNDLAALSRSEKKEGGSVAARRD